MSFALLEVEEKADLGRLTPERFQKFMQVRQIVGEQDDVIGEVEVRQELSRLLEASTVSRGRGESDALGVERVLRY